MRVLGQKKNIINPKQPFFSIYFTDNNIFAFFFAKFHVNLFCKSKKNEYFLRNSASFSFFLAKFLFTKKSKFCLLLRNTKEFFRKSYLSLEILNTIQFNEMSSFFAKIVKTFKFSCLSIFIFSSFQVLLEIKAEMLNISCQGKTLNSATLSKKF